MMHIRESSRGLALKLRLVPIPVNLCLRGGDNGVTTATFSRLTGDLRYASRTISEWPHVKLLQQYDALGEQLWEQEVFTKTEYYRNAALNIEIFGNYFDAVSPDQIQWGARRYAYSYHGLDAQDFSADIPDYQSDPYEYISVRPVKDSAYFQVCEGHHRLAMAYMKGMKTVPGLILQPAVSTPLQDLLRDVLWLKGRRELYQPVDSPEVAGWTLVRHCTDRQAKMMAFLRAEGLMPPAARSYLDVACSYGWFVSEMSKAGFHAEGVERDPISITVGQVMYGLRPEQIHRSDAVTFLRASQEKYDVTACLSLAHHFLLHRLNASAEELLYLLDSTTRRVMFFEMGEGREYSGPKMEGWDSDHIHRWLEANTTFTRIVRLGVDMDSVSTNRSNFGRMLFACLR
jgi:hypothetical protein